jgi:hypothetical protein
MNNNARIDVLVFVMNHGIAIDDLNHESRGMISPLLRLILSNYMCNSDEDHALRRIYTMVQQLINSISGLMP